MLLSKRFLMTLAMVLVTAPCLFADDDSGSCKDKDGDSDGHNAAPAQPAVNAPDWSGSYSAIAVGFYCGKDSVSVNAAGKLHLQLSLKDKGGNGVNFNVANLDIVDGHFKGSGNVNGVKIDVDGRFDAPAPGQPWKIRFICNYRENGGQHAGRIIGIKD